MKPETTIEMVKTTKQHAYNRWVGVWVAFFLFVAVLCTNAQTASFRASQVRVTVPVNYSGSAVITNLLSIGTNGMILDIDGFYHINPVTLNVTGLPAGATYSIVDTNGTLFTATAARTNSFSTNVWLNLYLNNVAEGVYTFSLNAADGATNHVNYVLQVAHIWTGSLGVSNNWANASSWQGGAPSASGDVVFGNSGAQTNTTFASGISFTNVGIDSSVTVGSIRFAQSVYTNLTSTNALYHTIRMAPGVTLSVTGTNGFSFLRDYIGELGVDPDRTMGVTMVGTNATLFVSNTVANVSILIGNSLQPTLNLSNLSTFIAYGNRIALADYQPYPNYRNYNDENNFSRNPRVLMANVYLARTNYIKALYSNPDNYTNEFTRAYAMSYANNEAYGNGSSVSQQFFLGMTNQFLLDSVCFIGASSASGNNGSIRFNPALTGASAQFRNTNGGRMAVFTVSDDGGTNQASSNVKGTVDFASGNGYVDILADRLYISRDRTLIVSNQSPNVQGDLWIGRGVADFNTAILGFQEHDGKTNWTAIGGAQAYLNYCQGRLFVTNGGVVKINGTLTLGYTADTNPESVAQQYNTYGQLTIYSNSTVTVSNIVVDGGLNYTSFQPRANRITVTQGALVVSNSIGAAPGLKLDQLSMETSTLTVFANPARTNVLVKTLLTPGTSPTTIKVASLTGISTFPAQIPIISYDTASSPYLVADVSALGVGYVAYVLNNVPNKTVDLYITTNTPNNLIWTGSINNNWDTTTKNWVTVIGGIQTNFSLGDSVIFNDSSSVTNVNIVDSVVPGQSGAGVVVSNFANSYYFSGGTIAGTALLAKYGTNILTIDAVKQGPLNMYAGTIAGGGSVGFVTMASNTVLNYSGSVNGGLISTGAVTVSTLVGPVTLRGGSFTNNGTVSTAPGAMTIDSGVTIVNNGTLNVSGGAWDLPVGSVLANFGTINNISGRLNFEGLLYGTGSIIDPNGGGLATAATGRVSANPLSVWSPGATPEGSIGSMNIQARVDFNNTPNTSPFGYAQLRIEVDFSDPQINDIINADKWNNITGVILMTNINPSAGSFATGQSFQVFANNNGLDYPNSIDVNGTYPLMWPPVPKTGLQWGLADFRTYGKITITNSSMIWRGNIDGNWDTNTANWLSGQKYSDGNGAVLDDSATGTTSITLNGPLAPIGITVVSVTNIVPNVSTNIVITTNTPVMSPGMVVSNAVKDYVIAGPGKITGMTSLYKTGPGTLSLLSSNDYTGNTIIDGGTVVVTNNGANANLAAFGISGNNNEVLVDGGTIKYAGTTNINFNNFIAINDGGATLEITSATNEVTLNKLVFGSGALTKAGAGTLILSQSSDTYAGGTTVGAGVLRLTAAGAGGGAIVLANTATLQLTNNANFTNAINIAGSSANIQLLGASTNVAGGRWFGNGTANFILSATNMFVFNGSLTNFTGIISAGESAGVFRFNNSTNSNPATGSTNVSFDLGTGSAQLNNLNGAGLVYDLGALSGGANTVLSGRSTNSAAPPGTTYSIGAKGINTVFSGKITDGLDTVSVVKVGSSSLLLNGTNTYTGSTIVSNGVLGGNGSIASPLTIAANGTLSPGASVGTFTVSSSVTLGGKVLMELDRSNPATNDQLVVTGTLTGGGTLVVTNIGPDLYNNSTFKLFSKPVTGLTVTLPATDPTGTKTYVWNNNLATDGSITLTSGGASGVNTNSTNIVATVTGNALTLSWPSDHTGWTLQVQTNALNVGLGTNWVTVPGSSATNSVIVPIVSGNGSVFYRLIYP